ncbi:MULTISPECIES: sensor histidine kinase [Streptomycetaceae]|nr:MULTISPECIES: ATP-binding protein [Streptomycetaceae]MYS57450.1 GAF domain-containing protein [Streptomyces sp. SID5468]CCB73038.1 putative Histidine kinase [Streptantibioticus cattleyicolor NRRL 8057 = DSM 46488]
MSAPPTNAELPGAFRPAGLGAACAGCGAALLGAFAWVATVLVRAGAPRTAGVPFASLGVEILLAVGFALSGTVSLAHRRGSAVGRLLLAAACAKLLPHAAAVLATAAGAGPGLDAPLAVATAAGDITMVFALFALPLWLPGGRLPGRRWGVALAVAVAAWSVLQQFYDGATEHAWYGVPNPLTRAPWAALAGTLTPWLGAGALDVVPPLVVAVTLGTMAVRWPRCPKGERPKGALLLPYLLWIVVIFFGFYLGLRGTPARALYYADAAVWPLALGYAFARDRSWHLSRSARRALSVILLTTALVALGSALALALSLTLPGARTPGALALACAALLIGVALRSSARWAARVVDRFYYGERAHPYQVVRELAERLGRAVSPREAPELLCGTVVGTLRLAAARVTVATSEGARVAAGSGGAPAAGWTAFPLVYEGAVIGTLLAAPRPGEPVLDEQDRDLLRFLAGQAAPAIASLRLYEELQASRERLVVAREEARRRLRHDLHDGLGPALSGLRLQVDTVRAAVPEGTEVAGALVAVSDGIADAVRELRRITDGLAPGALDREGLTEALRQVARGLCGGALRTGCVFRPDPLPPLPPAVEVAVYRIAAEALHNVVRHAGAATARLTVAVAGATVAVEVADDGDGLPGAAGRGRGLGLRSMAERAEELGGSLELSPGPAGRGTTVRAVLPLASGGGEPHQVVTGAPCPWDTAGPTMVTVARQAWPDLRT